MRLELTFKNGTTLIVSENSVIEPSGSLDVRNKLRVFAPDVNLPAFVSMFSDEENLDELLFVGYVDDTDDEIFRHELHHYTIVAELGKKHFESTDPATGEKISTYLLTAVLEQPTPIEQGEPVPDPETEEILDILLGREE